MQARWCSGPLKVCTAAGLAWGLVACAASHPYVWVGDLPPGAMVQDTYRIQAGDEINVLVWNQPKLSATVRVRPDGQVTLPLLGDAAVVGLSSDGAARQVERRLNGLVVDPKVTVTLTSMRTPTVSVLGQVAHVGIFDLRSGEGVLDALAKAGGLTPLADDESIFVLRRGGQQPTRIRFTFRDLAGGSGKGVLFQLRDGDIVVVE